MLCPTSEPVSILLYSEKRQLCRFLCDFRKITHFTFLGFPSLIFKMGQQYLRCEIVTGEKKMVTLDVQSLQTVMCYVKIRYYCFINPSILLRNLFKIYTKLYKNAVKQYILFVTISICQQMEIYVIISYL